MEIILSIVIWTVIVFALSVCAYRMFFKKKKAIEPKTKLEVQIRAIETGITEKVAEELEPKYEPSVEEVETKIMAIPATEEQLAAAKKYVDTHADCWPVGFSADRFSCGRVFTKPVGLFSFSNVPEIIDDARDIPYEEIENAFWSKCKEIDKQIKEEHDHIHCPRGQHVWKKTTSNFYFTCEVCNYYYEKCPITTSCAHCEKSERISNESVARDNQLRRLLWLGQKAGHISAPVKKDKPMSFLWRRTK